MSFAFLILHYMNSDVTMNCINSILSNVPGDDYSIVVVDNASQNGSYEELLRVYGNDKKIHFICNEENLGYAKGNNVGFRFAKNVLKAEWVCLANNDLVFSDSEWITKIYREYEESPFYVLGPDIVTPQGEHQNPFCQRVPDQKSVLKKLFHDVVVYILLKLGIQRKLRSKMKEKDVVPRANSQETLRGFQGVLHGSCLVFSPDYVKEFDGLYAGTFLYAEEEILCYILQKLKCPYTFYSDLRVTHCHATSFKRSIQDEDRRKMVIVKERIKSYKKFLRILLYKGDAGKFLRN